MRKTAFWLILSLLALCLSLGIIVAQPLPQPTVTVLVNRDGVNVRLFPAIGAEVIGFVNAGWTAPANGRSPDNQWLRIDFNGQEGWLGFPVITVLAGDINALPVADPRSIPYGGFESPRAGASDASSAIIGRLSLSGVRLRAGPSTAYPVLANPPRYTEFPLLGRTRSNAWLQVNYNGTLGWVTAGWVEILGGRSIVELPIDGVVASAPPISEETEQNYFAILRLMLARLDLAQPSLDSIRQTWTTVALGQRSACQNFPARPSDMNIAQPLLAAFYPTLFPLQMDFNSAMANVRLAIDLWIEACGFPQPPQGVVGQATVQGALNAIQIADAQFADLRRRISELVPPLLEVGPDECLFTFNSQFDILKIISKGQVVQGSFNSRDSATGFCIDLLQGDAVRIELLTVKGTLLPLVAISPFDNPTQFLGVGRGITGQNLLTLGPILISTSGRYLIIVSDTSDAIGESHFALLVTNIAGQTLLGPGLALGPNGEIVVNPTPSFPTSVPGFVSTPADTGVVVCPSLAFTCNQLFTCEEAIACLQAGNFSLDPDADGIPCEENLCTGS